MHFLSGEDDGLSSLLPTSNVEPAPTHHCFEKQVRSCCFALLHSLKELAQALHSEVRGLEEGVVIACHQAIEAVQVSDAVVDRRGGQEENLLVGWTALKNAHEVHEPVRKRIAEIVGLVHNHDGVLLKLA